MGKKNKNKQKQPKAKCFICGRPAVTMEKVSVFEDEQTGQITEMKTKTRIELCTYEHCWRQSDLTQIKTWRVVGVI